MKRWKRWALLALWMSALLGRDAWAAEEEPPLPLPVLMYHEVKPERLGKDAISPQELEADLLYLAREGYTPVSASQLVAYVYGEGTLPEKPVLLTFDDGYLNNYLYAYPLWKQYGTPVLLSLLGRDTDEFTRYPSSNIHSAHVTWEQLAEMAGSGLVEVGNHSYDLHAARGGRLGCLPISGQSGAEYEAMLQQDVGGLQRTLYQRLGQPAQVFAYPYGKYCGMSEGILEELGFAATLGCDWGVNTLRRDPDCLYGLKRIGRPHGRPVEELLPAAMAAWKG